MLNLWRCCPWDFCLQPVLAAALPNQSHTASGGIQFTPCPQDFPPVPEGEVPLQRNEGKWDFTLDESEDG